MPFVKREYQDRSVSILAVTHRDSVGKGGNFNTVRGPASGRAGRRGAPAEKFLDLVAAQVATHAPVLPKWRVNVLGDNAVVDGCMAAGNDRLTTSVLD
jgi:hypothetical protein